MALPVGSRLGPYEIVAPLGAGGMGEVYRARDTRLGREVALKIVPRELAGDETAHKRFHAEARTLSSINHPNIAALYEFDVEEGIEFLVMELVEGASLRERLRQGALPAAEVQALGVQLAHGLAAAHDAGIVHRDLKPENLVVTPRGHLKILDFGLAKLTGSAIAAAATVSFITEQGATPGTLPYMAPEQLRGEELDARTDIYGAGAVLYEMATGRRLFDMSGPMLVDAILNREPVQPIDVNPQLPEVINAIIMKALCKSAASRYESARELGIDLERMNMPSMPVAGPTPATSAFRRRRSLLYAGTFVAALTIAASVWVATRGPAPLKLQYTQVTNFADSATSPALSPDGRMLTFLRGESTFFGPGQVYVRLLPEGEPVQLTHDAAEKGDPRFTPDGSQIAYVAGPAAASDPISGTYIVPTLGGKPPTLYLPYVISVNWFEEPTGQPKRLLYSKFTGHGAQLGIATASESRAGERVLYMPPAPYGMAHHSAISPDRKYVLVSAEMDANNWLPCHIVPYQGGPAKVVGPAPSQCTSSEWSPDGQWMYFTANTGSGFHIWRQRFPDGTPAQITFGTTEEEGVAFAPDGRSFLTAIGTRQSTVWVHDARGDRQITSEGYGLLPVFSPDGKKLYYLQRTSAIGSWVNGKLWVVDLETGERRPLLPDFLMEHFDISADGKRVVFVAGGNSEEAPVWVAALDSSVPPRRVFDKPSALAFFGRAPEILVWARAGAVSSVREDGTQLHSVTGLADLVSVSPDGKWAARFEEPGRGLLAQPLDAGDPVVVSTAPPLPGTFESAPWPPSLSWSRDGRFLYLKPTTTSTYAIPLSGGKLLPLLPATGFRNEHEIAAYPGAKKIADGANIFPGPNPSVYAFTRIATQRNIYRVTLQ